MKSKIIKSVRLLGLGHENQKNNIKVVSKKLNTLLVIAFIAIQTACSKDEDGSDNQKEAIVYIAGEQKINNKAIATIWENGKPKTLTDDTEESTATSMYVANNNVYVVGYKNLFRSTVAKLWTNGVEIDLGDPRDDNFATAVFVSGNDVYVAGYGYTESNQNKEARLWKNGIEVVLNLDTASIESVANTVYVSGGNVYLGGSSRIANNPIKPVIWKNNEASIFLKLDDKIGGEVNSIYVSDNIVYAAGKVYSNSSEGFGTIWKNDLLTSPLYRIINDTKNKTSNRGNALQSYLKSIFIKDKIVYTAGATNKEDNNNTDILIARLITNGVKKNLSDITKNSVANSVFALDNDVYTVGLSYDLTYTKAGAIIWKNGAQTNLETNTTATESKANSIFVIKK
jgi:hypothetical protein